MTKSIKFKIAAAFFGGTLALTAGAGILLADNVMNAAAEESNTGVALTEKTVYVDSNGNISATEAEGYTAYTIGLKMAYGASVRYTDTESDKTGMRFKTLVKKDGYDSLPETAKAKISFGTLIGPADLNASGLTFESGEANYINVAQVKSWYTAFGEGEDSSAVYYAYNSAIVDIYQANYSREFIGVGYMKIEYSPESTEYVYATANNNTRSVKYVAQQALEKESDLTFEKSTVLNTYTHDYALSSAAAEKVIEISANDHKGKNTDVSFTLTTNLGLSSMPEGTYGIKVASENAQTYQGTKSALSVKEEKVTVQKVKVAEDGMIRLSIITENSDAASWNAFINSVSVTDRFEYGEEYEADLTTLTTRRDPCVSTMEKVDSFANKANVYAFNLNGGEAQINSAWKIPNLYNIVKYDAEDGEFTFKTLKFSVCLPQSTSIAVFFGNDFGGEGKNYDLRMIRGSAFPQGYSGYINGVKQNTFVKQNPVCWMDVYVDLTDENCLPHGNNNLKDLVISINITDDNKAVAAYFADFKLYKASISEMKEMQLDTANFVKRNTDATLYGGYVSAQTEAIGGKTGALAYTSSSTRGTELNNAILLKNVLTAAKDADENFVYDKLVFSIYRPQNTSIRFGFGKDDNTLVGFTRGDLISNGANVTGVKVYDENKADVTRFNRLNQWDTIEIDLNTVVKADGINDFLIYVRATGNYDAIGFYIADIKLVKTSA